jgi:two-component system response regulator YesN
VYNVVIVDDEEPVLESYSYLIRTGAPEFRVAGTARSGLEAVTCVREIRPDVVIMDIAMPGIDGLSAIEELRTEFPEMLFILSTAYERFDLAQRAIPLGVFSYLVKPVSKKQFHEALASVRDHLDEKRERASHRLETVSSSARAIEWEKRNFLFLITWKILTEEEWSRYRSMFSFGSDTGRIVMVGIDHDGDEAARKRRYGEIEKRLSFKLPCIADEYLGNLMIFVPGSSERERVHGYLTAVIESLLTDKGRYRIGIGGLRQYDELYLSCNEALESVADPDPAACAGESEQQQVAELRKAVMRAASFEQVYPAYKAFSDSVFCSCSFPVAKAKMVALFTLLLDDLYEISGGRDESRVRIDPAREIMELQTREAWESWGARSMRQIVEQGRRERHERLPAPLSRAMRIVEERYDSPLQLSQVAEACGITPSYLCRLFSEHMDTNFVDYVNTVRLKVAEEMLIENRRSVKEIAYAVGYADPNYFSRIFKKYKGIPPTSYHPERDEHETIRDD